MKQNRSYDLLRLAKVREKAASTQVRIARENLEKEKADLEKSELTLARVEYEGNEKLRHYMNGKPSIRDNYSIRLHGLRALISEIDMTVAQIKMQIISKKKLIKEAEHTLNQKLEAFAEAHKRLEKLNKASEKLDFELRVQNEIPYEAGPEH